MFAVVGGCLDHRLIGTLQQPAAGLIQRVMQEDVTCGLLMLTP